MSVVRLAWVLLSFCCAAKSEQLVSSTATCSLPDCFADDGAHAFELLQKSMEVNQEATQIKDTLSKREVVMIEQMKRKDQTPENSNVMLHARARAPEVTQSKTLTQIFQKVGTDKMWRHGYHRYYETQLAPYRNIKDARILEIGADSGISLGAWMEYFNAPSRVQGVAYEVDPVAAKDKACEIMPADCKKLDIFSMDQSDTKALANLVSENPEGWDVVIDDGSHKPQHQLISFQRLWPNVRPGGLYAIEDIETSYVENGSVYNYPLHGGPDVPAPENAVEHFKKLVDVVNRKHFMRPEFTVFDGADKDVASVNFADGLIFIQKQPADPEWEKYPQDLAFAPQSNEHTYQAYKKKVKPMNNWFRAFPH